MRRQHYQPQGRENMLNHPLRSCLSLIAVFAYCQLGSAGLAQDHQQNHQDHQPEHGHQHHQMSLDQYIARLEDPTREEWQQPEAVIEALKLQSDAVVADIGAGSGYFTLRLARAIAPKGRVYAVDTESGMLDYLRQRLREADISNVQVMKVPAHDPLLVDGSIDVIFICNTYHHLEDRAVYLRKLSKALKPNGRLVIVDFNKEGEIPAGPPPAMRLSKEAVTTELRAEGLRVAETLSFLPYQYILIAQLRAE